MSRSTELLKAGTFLGLGNLATRINAKDLERFTGISRRQLRKYAGRRGDAMLGLFGLRRKRRLRANPFLIIGAAAASALIGTGVMLFLGATAVKRLGNKIEGVVHETADEAGQAGAGAAEETVTAHA